MAFRTGLVCVAFLFGAGVADAADSRPNVLFKG